MTFRGFIAAEVPGMPALEVLATELRSASRALKVVDPNQLHLTLKFLGDTDEGLVPQIVDALRAATADTTPFSIRVRGIGAFPNIARMNVIWVGVDGAEPLARIGDSLERSLESLGFPRERRAWKAHVTLARVKGRENLDRVRRIIESHSTDDVGSHRVDAVHLKKSVLSPDGARYSIVETVRLGT
jgi:2'-5' RNA ligase